VELRPAFAEQEGTGSLVSVVADSLFSLIENGNGPAPGMTVGALQLSAVSGTLIVTDADPSAPRPSFAVRLTGNTPATLKVWDTLLIPAAAATVSHVSGKVHVPVAESPKSASEIEPEKLSVAPLETVIDAVGLEMMAVGGVFPEAGT